MNTSRYIHCVKWLTFLCLLVTGTTPTLASEKITYHHLDALGSPVAATNEQGNLIWRETYQPYGERIQKSPAAADNTRGYTGHPQDDTGLIYAGARYYDPSIGRFLAVDPVGYSEQNLYSFNRYAYGNNNPYRYVDPDGSSAFDSISSWWNNSVIGFRSESPTDAAWRILQGWPVGKEVMFVGAALGTISRGVTAEQFVVKGAGQLGREGETAVRAVYDIGDKANITINGVKRIPDGINLKTEVLSEIKNVKNLSFTKQLRDYSTFAQQNGLGFDLYVRPGANLSGPLLNARDVGQINILEIPFR